MIHELAIQDFRPGRAAEAARIAGTAEAVIRGDAHGVLAGCWISEVGVLNRMLTLRAFDSQDARERALVRAQQLQERRREFQEPQRLLHGRGGHGPGRWRRGAVNRRARRGRLCRQRRRRQQEMERVPELVRVIKAEELQIPVRNKR